MNVKYLLAGAAIAASTAIAAEAATYPEFTLDTSASTIVVTQDGSCTFLSCATLTGEFAGGATGFSWTPTDPNESVYVDDFFEWTVSGTGLELFEVDVTLVFSAPDSETVSSSSSGVFLTFGGVVSAGVLVWDGTSSVTFPQGSTVEIDYENVFAAGFGNSTTSGATFTGSPIAPIAPVPLPPSIPLLGAGLLTLGLVRRRRKKAAA